MKITFDQSIWYSPQILFKFIDETLKESQSTGKKIPRDLDKLMKELWSSLLFIPGINILNNRLHYVQPVDPAEQERLT